MLSHAKFTNYVMLWRGHLGTFRIPIVICAAILYCGGAYWSFNSLEISPAALRLVPLALLACLMLPSLLYGGLGLCLLARSAGLSIPPGKATVVAAYAYLAELLPVPGGAIVRTGALMKAGGSLQRSSALVILTAILWISLALIGAGLALLQSNLRLAVPALLIGTVIAIPIFGWLWATAGVAIAVQTLLHRIAGIALMAVRLQFAFAALHTSIDFSQTLPFVLASIIGSASSIAPAGLGVSESLAALAATTSAYPSSTAFLAVGLDRFLGLISCILVVIITKTCRSDRRSQTANGAESSITPN